MVYIRVGRWKVDKKRWACGQRSGIHPGAAQQACRYYVPAEWGGATRRSIESHLTQPAQGTDRRNLSKLVRPWNDGRHPQVCLCTPKADSPSAHSTPLVCLPSSVTLFCYRDQERSKDVLLRFPKLGPWKPLQTHRRCLESIPTRFLRVA